MPESSHTNSTFSTERLPLACYLHADGRLQLLGCEPGGNTKFRFVFADPDHIGDKLEFDYERGALIAATALFASQKFLRRKIDEAEERTPGGFIHARRR